MKFIFIINPFAGNDDKVKMLSRIKSTFRRLDDDMILEETHAPGDAKVIAKKYSGIYGDKCVIVSCGGDGTVHEIANGLAGTDTPLMVLPLGTGNDFAKKLYGTKTINVENVIKAFGFYNGNIKYDIKPIDLIDYNGEKCINVMSFGLDTLVAMTGKNIATKYPFLGHQAYNIAIAPVLSKPLHYTISFELNCYDPETRQEYTLSENNKDYALMAICNASYYGGGFCPAPNSVLDDGLLDLAMFDGMSLARAVPLIAKYFAGKVNQDNCDTCTNAYITSGRIWMEDGSSLPGNCDGEGFNYSEVNFKIEHKALKLCVPRY